MRALHVNCGILISVRILKLVFGLRADGVLIIRFGWVGYRTRSLSSELLSHGVLSILLPLDEIL